MSNTRETGEIVTEWATYFKNKIPIMHNKQILNTLNTPVFTVSSYLVDDISKVFIINTTDKFDDQWLSKSIQYSKALKPSHKFILLSYTIRGDVLANNYLRNPIGYTTNEYMVNTYKEMIKGMFESSPNTNKTYRGFPFSVQLLKMNGYTNTDIYFGINGYINNKGYELVKQLLQQKHNITQNIINPSKEIESILPYIKEYIQDLSEIINKAPKTTRIMKVYRGVKSDYLNNMDTPKQLLGFNSTTYNFDSAAWFAKGYESVIYEILINPGVPCINIPQELSYVTFQAENEILINTGVYGIASNKTDKITFSPKLDKLYSFMNKTYSEMVELINPSSKENPYWVRTIILAESSNNTFNNNKNNTKNVIKGGNLFNMLGMNTNTTMKNTKNIQSTKNIRKNTTQKNKNININNKINSNISYNASNNVHSVRQNNELTPVKASIPSNILKFLMNQKKIIDTPLNS